MLHRFTLLTLLLASTAQAGPYIPPGDIALRQDIQRLADIGVIKGTVTTWPLAWGPILRDLQDADATTLPPAAVDALLRIKRRAGWETRTRELTFDAKLGAADNATRIRGFQETPRGRGEASVGINWIGNWLSADVNVQYVDDANDDQDLRFDNSMLGIALGNWSGTVSTMQRWWGPGWDGSLILSNNARPIPSIMIDRIHTDAFETKWLSWLGPWDLSVIFGQLERERAVPNAQFFGMRLNFRPLSSLEIGLSRTAQWCGDDRPCNSDVFVDLLLGRDNVGDAGIGAGNEPGNQMAGIDFRWAPSFTNLPVAAYAQFIGEDEAGGFPSRYLVQAGLEGAGYMKQRWSYRWFVELAGTSCDFIADARYDCAYRQSIYQSGYTFRDRPIGHGLDNDARSVSIGWIMVDAEDQQWHGLVRTGELNRGGTPDFDHYLTPTPQDILSIDVAHSRAFTFGTLAAGIGYEATDDKASGSSSHETRVYVQWTSSY